MKTVFKRLSIISLAGVMLALLVWGGGLSTRTSLGVVLAQTQAASLPPARPAIRAEVNGAPFEGTPGSACWPQADGSPQCDFVEEPVPSSTIDVSSGETLTFVVDPASPAPAELWATLPNDKNADGEPQRTDLLQSNGELALTDLPAGPHAVQVQAIYAGDVSGNKPFVTYAFLVNVGTAVAVAGSATPAATTPEATQEAVTPEVTGTPEAAGTEATPEATVIVVQPTEEPTLEPTATSSTGGAVVIPATLPATSAAIATLEATPIEPTTPPPTTVPTALPTATPTAVAELPTTTPAAPVAATPGAVETSVAPELAVIVAGRSYGPIAISACVLGQAGEQTCINRPSNANADRILAAPGDVAQISFKGPRPSNIAVTIASADGITTIDKQNVPPDNLALYTLPSNPGSYVLSVEIAWAQGKATYYFRLVVGS